jgi:hypothetical protein
MLIRFCANTGKNKKVIIDSGFDFGCDDPCDLFG